MKNAKHLIQMTVAASMALSVFAACAPKATVPGAVNTGTTVTSPSGSTTTPSGSTTTPSTTTPAASTSTVASTMQSDLIALHDDEALYSDASTAAAGSGFSIKMEGLERSEKGEVFAAGLGLARPAAASDRASAARPMVRMRMALGKEKAKAAQERAKANLKPKKEDISTLKAQFKASGAVTVNEDGTITIDPVKFKAEAKAAMQQKKEKIEARVAKVKDKLQAAKEVAKDKAQQMRRKNNIVRTSDKQTVTNEDGSTTEIVKVSFENTKIGLKRDTYLSRTTMDGKLVSLDFKLDASHKNYTRSVHRTVTVNADGSRTVSVESTTTWKDGRKREVQRQHVVAADGSATGTGTITWTKADGTSTTRNLTFGASAAGEVTSSCTDAATQTTVTVEESASSTTTAETTATVTVEAQGSETTAVEVSVEAEVEAEAEGTTEAAASEGTETAASESSEAASTEASEATVG
ncbi:hypothetical protein COW64_14655 [bacterium (Candidatus Blackallbacteria) CG18_big_fil_WC_8_21_14_2_50_49_26]|nr:MAG: hypothetical protein COW64_14655 [bacterium (Candidatus Blackallbacteria) CG18_big_fil_WC_8_21_14_2_50_49_26]